MIDLERLELALKNYKAWVFQDADGQPSRYNPERERTLILENVPALLAIAREHAELVGMVREILKEISIIWRYNTKTGGIDTSAIFALNRLAGQLAALVGKETT